MSPRPLTGPALALARRRVGLSQIALARLLALSPATVRDWERQRQPIPHHAQADLRAILRAARLDQARYEQTRLSTIARKEKRQP